MNKVTKLRRKYFGTKSQIYFKTLFFFVISISLVFVHGLIQRDNQEYQEVELYEAHVVHQGALSVIKKVFNQDEMSFRMDLFFDPTSQSVDDLQRKIEASLVTNRNPENEIEVEVIPVTSRYFVLLVEGIESDAEIIRMDVSYFSTPETSQPLIFYAAREHSEEETISLLQFNERDLQVDSIQNDIRIQKEMIQASEEKSRELEEEIALRMSQYEQLTEEQKFQVGSELQETENKMSSIRTTLLSLQTQLEDEKEARKETNERIDLLEKRINEVINSSQ